MSKQSNIFLQFVNNELDKAIAQAVIDVVTLTPEQLAEKQKQRERFVPRIQCENCMFYVEFQDMGARVPWCQKANTYADSVLRGGECNEHTRKAFQK